MSKDIIFGAFYYDNSSPPVGKTGLTVTFTVYSLNISTLAVATVATAQPATTVGGGLYAYKVSAADLQTYYYYAIASTTDTTVDARDKPAVMLDWGDVTGQGGIDLTNIKQATNPTTLTNITVPTTTSVTNDVTVAAASKTGYALSSTGGDLILKTSTFALAMADAIWDEVLTVATHNVVSSAGRRLRSLGAFSIVDGQVDSATTQTVTLGAEASATAHIYDQNLIVITSGAAAGQTRMIIEYSTGKIAVVDRDWEVLPVAGNTYEIVAFAGVLLATHGTAQSGAASTITLATSALNIANSYVGCGIYIAAGTGAGQTRLITAYTTGRIATVSPAWDTQPDNTTVYKVIPVGRSIVETSNDKTGYALSTAGVQAVWDNVVRTLTQSAAAVTAAVSGSDITITRGDTLSAALTGLGNISSYVSLDFTVKTNKADADSAAILRIRKNLSGTGDGLLTINGAAAVTASKGSITVNNATLGNITIALAADQSALLEPHGGLYYDVQMITATATTTMTQAECDVSGDVTRAVT